jgi:undecaprenyl diphosphate synthase
MTLSPQSAQSALPPAHVAIIMDGNRRWAKNRLLPTAMGHAAGARRVRDIVQAAPKLGIKHLTLFAFSTENWRRPPAEVDALMRLFEEMLQAEVVNLREAGVKLRVLGDRLGFSATLQRLIEQSEATTANGTTLTLNIAANYGGRWDIIQAMQSYLRANPQDAGAIQLCEATLAPYLCTADLPEVDLLIRTGGEQRISNFVLWQAAYAEFFFTNVLWPQFTSNDLELAVQSFFQRDRRFGSSAVAI